MQILFGDMPYGAAGRAEYPRLLADINAARVRFSIFDGDLKAGGDGACTDALYTQSRDWFNSLDRPAGRQRLDRLLGQVRPWDRWLRPAGAAGPRAAGVLPDRPEPRPAHHDRRAGEQRAGYEAYRENVRWISGPVMYIGLNVQGSNDNLPHAGVDGETRSDSEIARMAAEHQRREQTNIHWLAESYSLATQLGLKGVLVDWQADPNFNNEQRLQPPQYDGYAEILPELRRQVIAFPGQSALVHGDNHYYKVDKPLNYDNGQVVAKFTRVETFGAANTHWVATTIDPRDPSLFEFSPRIVPGNVNDR